MKFEQDLVGREPVPLGRVPTTEARRDVRVITDALIFDALRANKIPPLVGACCDTMLTLARALNRHGIDPEVPDFIEAAVALIEDARTVFDAGMRVDDMGRAKIGAVMLEVAVRGICAALSIDYENHMRARLAEGKADGNEVVGGPGGAPGDTGSEAGDGAPVDGPVGLDDPGVDDRPG